MIIVRLDATRCCAKSLINKLDSPEILLAGGWLANRGYHQPEHKHHFTNRANTLVATKALKVWGFGESPDEKTG